jgi:hypothetical protein
MSRLVLKPVLLTTAVFLLFSLTARALGSTRPSTSTLAGFNDGCEGKPHPCWHGIVPGSTSLDAARQILARHGYHNERALDQITTVFDAPEGSSLTSVNLIHQGNYLWMVGLYPHTGLSLSSALAALGSPDGMVAIRPHDLMGLSYGQRVRVALQEQSQSRLSPFAAQIKYVTLTSEPVEVLPWHGFVPFWRYCQLEPSYAGCV